MTKITSNFELAFTEMRPHPNYRTQKTLHTDIRYLIKVAQLFGMFPLNNILHTKLASVEFKWKSPWTIYAIFIIMCTFFFVITSLVRICVNEFKLHLVDSFLFSVFSLLILLAFFKIAMRWPKLAYDFKKIEGIFRNCGYQKNCKPIFTLMLSLSTISMMMEHSLAVTNTYFNIDPAKYQELNRTRTEQYFVEEFPFVFDYLPYYFLLGMLAFFVNLCNVFSWSFIDSFILIMSYALAYRFKQIHYNVKYGINKKITSTSFWGKLRQDYTQMAVLCQRVNDTISNIILISFGANMYFIVTQLYKGLVTRRTTVDQCYFLYSFGLLLLRCNLVLYFGSMVQVESKKPLDYLICIRDEAFNVETQRFLLQIHTQDTSLSGGQFFTVTRGLLVEMTAFIITYVVILLQTEIAIYL